MAAFHSLSLSSFIFHDLLIFKRSYLIIMSCLPLFYFIYLLFFLSNYLSMRLCVAV